MFGYGGAGGFLADVRDAGLDTSKWEEQTKLAKADISKSIAQLNESTVGAYNNQVKADALERAEKETPEEIGGLTEERRQQLLQRIKNRIYEEEYKGKFTYDLGGHVLGSVDKEKEYQAQIQELQEKYENGEISDEDLLADAGGADFMWTISDAANSAASAIGDGISAGLDYLSKGLNYVSGLVTDAFGLIKGEMCNNSPFRECVGCPNRPKLHHVKPGLLSGLGNIMSLLKGGLTDALTDLLDCPGMGSSLANGDFKKAGGALATAAISTAVKTAASIGSAVVMGGIARTFASAANYGPTLGKLVANIPGTQTALSATNKLMSSAGLHADNLFSTAASKITPFAVDSALGVAGRALARSEKAGAGFIGGILAGDSNLAVGTTLNDLRKVPAVSKVMCARSVRNRHRLAATKMRGIYGCTFSVREFKTAFSVDSIKNGRRPPRDTRVRVHKSSSDTLCD